MPKVGRPAPIVSRHFPAVLCAVNVGLANLSIWRQWIDNFNLADVQFCNERLTSRCNRGFLPLTLNARFRILYPTERQKRDNQACTDSKNQSPYSVIHINCL